MLHLGDGDGQIPEGRYGEGDLVSKGWTVLLGGGHSAVCTWFRLEDGRLQAGVPSARLCLVRVPFSCPCSR